ncbi:hypothetical protein G647_06633 [Cladophialophora carrionii CBS 160.54]|uniref:Uncharacterized protein n=1 Tax=Cladophialophora carrionii CBS 160.54 TaxID=1279043 RepID=V9D9A8_9EURO|nr:uncharacterized protein G647_06633 [Cladophialophora carrionii CBS 160.54]ETI22557.1 hypothetical protein G647_06633 [Cladophialophora carrionii CBS 160.54]
MPKQSSKSGKRQKRDDDNDSDESADDDIQPIHFFVPGENINAAVLVEYINRYVDRTAKITSAQHPTDKNRTGFNVSAKRSLNAVSIRDLINDSKDWDLETQSREYRRNPYDYRESDTAKRRAKKGPSEGGTNRPQQPRARRETTAEPQDVGRQERGPVQPSGGSGASQPHYQAQYAQYSSQSQPQNVQASSYGYTQPTSPPTNINITMNAAAFAPSRAGQPAQYPAATYTSGGYAHPTHQESEPPPAYQPSITSRGGGSGPQPPAQPGPDTFDADKPAISRSQSAQQQERRGSSYDQSGRRSAR